MKVRSLLLRYNKIEKELAMKTFYLSGGVGFRFAKVITLDQV